MIEQSLIHLLFGCAVGATVAYALGIRRGEPLLRIGRLLFTTCAVLLVASASVLLVHILRHDFEYTYVQAYSARDLPFHLLVACLYSGQEGSFLLWTLLVSVLGVLLTPYARRRGYEGQAMTFYGLIICFLALLLVAKNPFALVWETYARDGIPVGRIPPAGRGLNPLLHNGWITIHPPILFTGFAAMSVSFAFAMAGLIKRDVHRWIDVALPWTLFATAVLGFGIMLGGFWAYETLGWGGFWGWDPVENSSLIPWLVSVALVHTMLVQKRTRGLVRTNVVLAVLAFVMVLYSTFLTRSGILGDTSVHSFVDPGRFAYWILMAFMATFLTIGLVMIIRRRRDLAAAAADFSPTTREFMLSIGSALILASAVIVTVGTSWPIVLELVNQPKVAVQTTFYNQAHAILLPLILVINGLAFLVHWRSTQRADLLRRVIIAASITAVATGCCVLAGIRDATSIALAAAAWFSLVVNVQMGWVFVRRSPSMLGAYVSHLGIALLVFGVITSAGYSEVHHAVLPIGTPTAVGDYVLTYRGNEAIEREFRDREKLQFSIAIAPASSPSSEVVVHPILYWSDFNNRQSAFLEPGIRWGLANDLYIAPKDFTTDDGLDRHILQRGTPLVVPNDTLRRVELAGFTMPTTEEPAPDGRMRMSALLTVSAPGAAADVLKVPTRIGQGASGMEFEPEWTALPGTTIGVGLMRIERNNADPSASKAEIAFRDLSKPMPKPRETFTVEFSVKPLISLVWFGVITMVAGFVFSILRYRRTANRMPTVAED